MVIRYEMNQHAVVTLTLDLPGKSTNLLGPALMDALEACVTRLGQEDHLAGVILTSAKKDFIVGADLDMLFAARDPEKIYLMGKRFKKTLRMLECLGKPVVSAINGSALGGGYEITLATHYRIMIHQEQHKVGLPEVKLGLFPGGGGTQRLPRMIGIQNALMFITEGKEFRPEQALANGLVNALAETEDDLIQHAHQWIQNNPTICQPWDRPDFVWPGGNPKGPAMAQLWAIAPSLLNQKTRANYPAQQQALAAIFEGSQVDFDTGDRIESRYFAKTATSQTAKNMINAFWYQMNRIRKGESRPQDLSPSRFQKVGILGAGMMGSGIAYACASNGIPAVLKDISLDQAHRGKAWAQDTLAKRVNKGRLSPEGMQATLELILPTDQASDLAGCDLIIEAVFEDRELKARVTQEAEQFMDSSGVFASNTSTLPISGLAEASCRPSHFIGLHFFSPVDKMPLVEIIKGRNTSSETLARAFDFVGQIRKTPIVVNDSRSFYTSRVFSTYVLEGIAMVQEGYQHRAIESAGLQAGMPVGPLALSDEVSLSLMDHIKTQTRKDLAAAGLPAEEHPADRVIENMVTQLHRPGKKAGKGFYDYPPEGQKHLWPGLKEVYPINQELPDQREMIERLMFIQAIETVRCLEEQVIESVADANLGSILGWGFAPFKGGTLQYINDRGLSAFVTRATELAQKFGKRFQPPGSLLAMAEKGELFQ